MNSPKAPSSPSFKNLKVKQKQSPVELKEKMRKNYKDRVHNCRNMLMNKFRGSIAATDLHDTLSEIYKSMFNFSDDQTLDVEETTILEVIKQELVQEEVEWWLQEYEKSQMDNIDWSSMEKDDDIICLVCQKANFALHNAILSCPNCKTVIRTQQSLLEIKKSVVNCIDKHNSACNNDVQFTIVPESDETHIYLICEKCMEMQLLV